MYANIQEDKAGRLRDYRIIAAYSEVADALDEICDETINPDDSGWITSLQLKDIDLTLKGKLDLKELTNITSDLDELVLPFRFDINIYHQIKNLDLLNHINRVGVTLYEKAILNLNKSNPHNKISSK